MSVTWSACAPCLLFVSIGCGSHGTFEPAASGSAQSSAESGQVGTPAMTGSPGASGVTSGGASGVASTSGTSAAAGSSNPSGSSETVTTDASGSGSSDANSGASAADGAAGFMGDASYANPADSVVWLIDNLHSIGGHPTSMVLGAPMVIATPSGNAVQFNGVGDALFVNDEPLAGFAQFTVEVIFRPDPGGAQAQRWFHMQAAGSDRVLFELRLNGDTWFLVSFVQSGANMARPYAVAFPHSVGPWYHVAIVVDGTTMKHYVNGVYENAGPCPAQEGCLPVDVKNLTSPYPLAYTPIGAGSTSLGCRITQMAFMKGAIRLARFTPRVLTPAEFVPLN